MEQRQIKTPKTRWQRLLGKMSEELLTPVGIEVYPEFPVMAGPPEADILLLRRATPQRTAEQSFNAKPLRSKAVKNTRPLCGLYSLRLCVKR